MLVAVITVGKWKPHWFSFIFSGLKRWTLPLFTLVVPAAWAAVSLTWMQLFQLLGEPWNIPVFGDSKIINPPQDQKWGTLESWPGWVIQKVQELGILLAMCVSYVHRKKKRMRQKNMSKKELLCSKLLGLFLWKVLKILTQEDGDNSSRAHPKLICVSVVRRHCGREMMTLCQHRASWAPAECFSCEFSLVLKCLKFCNATFNF